MVTGAGSEGRDNWTVESKATNFSYKISTRDVIYNAINIINAVVCYI